MARGVIIRSSGLGATLGARAMVDAMPVGVDVARTRALARSTDVLIFDELVSEEAARGIMTFMRHYADSATGQVPYSLWPAAVKGHFIVRVPPAGAVVA